MTSHLTIPGSLEWDSPEVERLTIATLRYAGGKEHDVRYVSEVHYDAALAREALLKRELEIAAEQVCSSEDREAALRESLTDKREEYNKLGDRYDDLQQRLIVAEQLLRETSDYLDGSTRNAVWCDSILHKKMRAALKPAAEGEGK